MTAGETVALSLTALASAHPHDDAREGLARSDEVNHN